MANESTRGNRAAGRRRLVSGRASSDPNKSRQGIVTKRASTFYIVLIISCISLLMVLVLFVAKPTDPADVSKDWFIPKRKTILAMADKVMDKQEGDGYSVNDPELQKLDEEQGTDKSKINWSQVPDHVKNFKPTRLQNIKMKNIYLDGKHRVYKEVRHKNKKSHVKIYTIDHFLSDKECDGLIGAHNNFVTQFNKQDPIVCFGDISTLRHQLKENNLNIEVSPDIFTTGTTCVNATFSSFLKKHLRWSYSTAFYPGESPFATRFAERVEATTGLKSEHGGKFQITSYPTGISYKAHTDCVVDTNEKRDRFATILVYLTDVLKGGHTNFTELGVPIQPVKGKALIWNNMDKEGNCDPTSIHAATEIIRGHKYIIQRWYYYESFYALGKRMPEPKIPIRKPDQPYVSCDDYRYGSCRWYDEWNYDHILAYRQSPNKL